MSLEGSTLEVRRAFGFLFIGVSVAVAVAAVLSEIAFTQKVPIYYYGIIWIASFGITFGASIRKLRKIIPSIRSRMKNSIRWSVGAKTINGLCWAGPFVAIGAFPSLLQYLILLGIGLGNLSTYILMKKYSGLDNKEQLIVGLISLLSIPAAIGIDTALFATHQDIAIMLSRILISISYAVGGVYALFAKDTMVP